MEGEKLTILLCGLLSLFGFCDAARILAVFPAAFKGDFSYNQAIMKSLHAAGHHITLISPFPTAIQLRNFTMVDSRRNTFMYVGELPWPQPTDTTISGYLDHIAREDEKYCYDVMQLKEIEEALNSNEKLYDIMFTQLISMYQCYLPIAQKLNIPIIGTVGPRSWKLSDPSIGFPNHPAVMPFELIDSKLDMNLKQRLQNLWANLYTDYFIHTVIAAKVNKFYKAYFPDPKLQYNKKISMVFYNNHASFLPRPSVPNAVDIGGIHIAPKNPLPQKLKNFIDQAEHGVILFTLGSIMKTSTMPVKLRTSFVNAFAAIPQRVIWRFDDQIEGLSNNVLLSGWLPQRDILDHKNVKAFISHCGAGGTYEAIYTGKPIVGVPLLWDQPSNAAILAKLGVAVHLNIDTLTTKELVDALNTVVNDTRYYERMQELSRIFKDRPMTPQQSVVYWTEYVIRHNGTPHLRAVGSEMPLYQYLLLDIILAVLVTIMVVSYLIFYVVKKLYRVLITRTRGCSAKKKAE